MKPSEFINLLVNALPARLNVGVKSGPGVGKTACFIEAVVRRLRWALYRFHLPTSDPTDPKGMPALIRYSNDEGEEKVRAEFVLFGDFRRLVETESMCCAFLDDFGQGTGATQASYMNAMWGGVFGKGGELNGHQFENVVWGVATNRRQDRAGVTGAITPLLDRLATFVELTTDVDDWRQWYISQPDELPPDVPAFIKFRPESLSAFDPKKDMEKTPTPRAWEFVGRLLKSGLDTPEIIKGAVGESAAAEFLAFQRIWASLPDRDRVLASPDSATIPEDMSVLYALMGSLAYGVRKETMSSLVKYLNRVDDAHSPEYAVFCIKDVIARDKKLKHTKAFGEWALKHEKVFGLDPDDTVDLS